MNASRKDARVDDYMQGLPAWQQALCQKIRALILAADSEIIETIKFTNRPYYTLQGNVCALFAAKDHVNIFIYDPIAPDPEKIINQGEKNVTARAIQIYQPDHLNEAAFTKLVQAVAANNRAGGWRKLKNKPKNNAM